MEENEELKVSTITVKCENVVEELKKIYPTKDKKKKKFVYLDKYESYVIGTQAEIKSLRESLNKHYIIIVLLSIVVIAVAIIK